jgi:hypothetical protein
MAHTDTHKAIQGILQAPRSFSVVLEAFLMVLLSKISVILNFIRIGVCGSKVAALTSRFWKVCSLSWHIQNSQGYPGHPERATLVVWCVCEAFLTVLLSESRLRTNFIRLLKMRIIEICSVISLRNGPHTPPTKLGHCERAWVAVRVSIGGLTVVKPRQNGTICTIILRSSLRALC